MLKPGAVFSPSLSIALLAAFLLLLVAPFAFDAVAAKRKPRPVKPPELRIMTVTASPDPYVPADGQVDFIVEIELPKEFEEGTLLEVSSLISSPSMSSMRFIAVRQPMSPPSLDGAEASSDPVKPRVNLTLTWDGMDQAKQRVQGGRYHYEVRAKLLTVRENVPRTLMNSWPKHGTLKVLAAPLPGS